MSLRRLYQELQACSIEGVTLSINEDDIHNLAVSMEGPDDTPYEGGRFQIRCLFGPAWPTAPPSCRFETKIFHPNVSSSGEICVNTLKKDWQPSHSITHILSTIKCLLIYPNPESALNEEAGKLLLEQYEDYARHAALITSVHAMLSNRAGISYMPPSTKTSESLQVSMPLQPSSSSANPSVPKQQCGIETGPAGTQAAKGTTAPLKKRGLKRL